MISAQPLAVEQGALQPLIVNTSDLSSPPRLNASVYKSLELTLKLFSAVHGRPLTLCRSVRTLTVMPKCPESEVSVHHL